MFSFWGFFYFKFSVLKLFVMFTEDDAFYMNRAISLAENGTGWVNPNPLVGAVIVKDGRIIAEGWHKKIGGLHAERNAFAACKEDCTGATMYVTLEPCCHYGKTPPCTEAIIEHKIARVVVGLLDPNPLVAGKGMEILRNNGIVVDVCPNADQFKFLNRVFLKYITKLRPWLVLKSAMTLDGKIATYTGDSKWVSSVESRDYSQKLRAKYTAIMVGSNTVKLDNPTLNCRLSANVRQPIRIVVDSKAAIDLVSNLVLTAKDFPLIIAHTSEVSQDKINELRDRGVETILCQTCDNRVDVEDMLALLAKRGIDSILLEGGGELNYSFVDKNCVDEVCVFIAPKIVGGRDAKTPVAGEGKKMMNDALCLFDVRTSMIGDDILVNALVRNNA